MHCDTGVLARESSGREPPVSRWSQDGFATDLRQPGLDPASLGPAGAHSTYRCAIAVSMRACAKRREIVAGCTSKRRAASAAVFFPLETILMISACCCGLSFGRRPPMCPCLRALSRPALVRSRSIARSNSANAPSICIAGDKGIIVTVCRPLLLGLIAEPRQAIRLRNKNLILQLNNM